MRLPRLTAVLTSINAVLLVAMVARLLPSTAVADAASVAQASSQPTPTVVPILRARAFELVDERGRVRSRLDVEDSGEVVLRLADRQGRIRVKLGAGDDGSGMVLMDEATEPGVHMIARRTGTAAAPGTTSVTLRAPGRPPRVLAP